MSKFCLLSHNYDTVSHSSHLNFEIACNNFDQKHDFLFLYNRNGFGFVHFFIYFIFILTFLSSTRPTCSSVFLPGQQRMFFTVYNWQVPHIFELIKYSVHIQESWNHLLQCILQLHVHLVGKNTDMSQVGL